MDGIVIKRGKYFYIANDAGNAPGHKVDVYGLYYNDTRVLSPYTVVIDPGTVNVTASSARTGDSSRVVLLADEVNSLASPPREIVIERRAIIRDGLIER